MIRNRTIGKLLFAYIILQKVCIYSLLITNILVSSEISEYEEEDKDRTSRLFYLQLYSDTLKEEKYERDENYRRKFKQIYVRKRKSEVTI